MFVVMGDVDGKGTPGDAEFIARGFRTHAQETGIIETTTNQT